MRRKEHRLSFPLLPDRLASVAAEFGVKYEEWEHRPAVCQRAVFAVDDSRTVRYRWYSANALEEPTLDELRESIEWLA